MRVGGRRTGGRRRRRRRATNKMRKTHVHTHETRI
jgi:hypothetical protein